MFNKYRYLNSDIFVTRKGGRKIRLLQVSKPTMLSKIASNEGNIASIINCSYFNDDTGTENDYVLGRNQGDLYWDHTHDQEGFFDLVFMKDGTYHIGAFKSWDYQTKDVLAGFSVGAILIENGADVEKYSSAIEKQSKITARNPQTAIAVLKDGDVLQIVVDGRTEENKGLTGRELRKFAKARFDIELLVLLDGGGSSEMIVNGEIVNQPSDKAERKMWNGLAFIGDAYGEPTEPQEEEQETKDDEEMKIKVIDISSHQGEIDYSKVKASGVQGVILRCGRSYWGQIVVAGDDNFEKHYKGFKAVGMPVGAYYYSCANTVAKANEEAQFVLKVLKDKQLEYPVYFDTENIERQQPLSKQALTDVAKAFLETLEKAGYYVGIYASSSWLKNELDMEQLKAYDVWVAHYNVEKPSYTGAYGMWQYTSSGKINGISTNVDMSHCYKDYPNIIKKAHLNGFTEPKQQECDHSAIEQENTLLKAENEQLKAKLTLWQSLIAKIKEILAMFK